MATAGTAVLATLGGSLPASAAQLHGGGHPGELTTTQQSTTLVSAASATSLTRFVTESGRVRLSSDAVGTNSGPATVEVAKNAGATVRKAFLAAAGTGNTGYAPADGDVTVDGQQVGFDERFTFPTSIDSGNALADVTALVKPKIDAAPAGRVPFSVTEQPGVTTSIDGVILTVILDDPSVPADSTITLLYGAQNVAGDQFSVDLSEPLDLSDPNVAAEFSLGISYGYQIPEFGGQYSTVDVNGTRLTSSAGGQDDGGSDNGELITVGGLDDNPGNPDPTAGANCASAPRCDDELYDIMPFLHNGDTSITVNTANPSSDDNVFFAALSLQGIVGLPNAPVGGPVASTETLGGGSRSQNRVQCSRVKPVNCVTGDFWHTFHDLDIDGRGVPLHVERTYNSLVSDDPSLFGYGWSSNYGMSLSVDATSGTVTIIEENGAQLVFTPDGAGGFTAPPRVLATLEPSGDSYIFTRRHRDTFVFNAAGHLTEQRDRNGYRTLLSYDPSGHLATVTDAAGRELTFTTDSNGRVTSITDPANRSVGYVYDAGGDLVQVDDVAGGTMTFTYDAAHRMLTMTDPRGGTVTNVYDAEGRVTSQTDAVGATTTFAYAPTETTITDPAGNVTVDEYAHGLLVASTRGAGTPQAATWRYSYDLAVLGLTSITDPNGHTETRTYDADSDITSKTDALGNTTTYTYDALGDLTSVAEPTTVAGHQPVTTFTYDAAGNPLTRTSQLLDAGGAVVSAPTVTFHYADAAHPGDVTSLTDPLGKTWSFAYDDNGQMTTATAPPTPANLTGSTATYGHNNIGWLTTSTAPNGNAEGADPADYTTTYAYDAFGRMTTVTDPLGYTTSRHYDANGNLDHETDGNGNTTTYLYDAVNQPTEIHRADGTVVKTGYDGNGNVTSQTDAANNATLYTYDSLGRKATASTPPTAACAGRCTTEYGYDAAGNLQTVTDPAGRSTSYTFDAANRVTAIDYSDPATPYVTNILYDANGRRTEMTDGTGTQTWAWDSLGRVTRHTDGAGKTVSYHWDLRNNLIAIDYPDNAGTVTRGYDDAGHWTSVTDWLGHTNTFDVDSDGNITRQNNANGTWLDQYFDTADRPTDVIYSRNQTMALADFGYERDGNGQVVWDEQGGVPGAQYHSYSYTALNQLSTVVDSPNHFPTSASYTYDTADNLTQHINGVRQAFDAANQLTASIPTISFVTAGSASDGVGTQTSTPVSLPTPARAGDQILVATNVSNTAQVTAPAGYTAVGTYPAPGGQLLYVWRRTATGGEQQATVGYPNASATSPQSRSITMVVYRNVDPVQPVDQVSVGTTAGVAKAPEGVTVPSLATAMPNEQLVLFEAARGLNPGPGTWTPPAEMTTRASTSASPVDSALAVADEARPNAGATGFRTASYSAPLSDLVGAMVALRPAATSYSYDAQGNRTTATTAGATALTLGYDQANRLSSYSNNATYSYDGDGLRTSKTVNGVTHPFTWDVAEGLPLLLADGATYYVYGPGGLPLEQISAAPPISRVATGVAGDSVGTQSSLTASFGPAAAARDQIVVATVLAYGSTATPPSGFTTVGSIPSPNGSKTVVFRKTAAGGESNVTVSYPNDSATNIDIKALAVAVYRNVDPDNPIDTSASASVEATNGGTALTVPSTSATVDGEQLVLFLGARGLSPTAGTWTIPAGMAKRGTFAGSTDVALDVDDQLLATSGPTGTRTSAYSASLSQLMGFMVALRPAPTPVRWYHHDQLGSTRALTDNYNAVVATYTYDPYGRLVGSTGNVDNPFRFAGQYTDGESGFIYLRARNYDPVTAQFISRDPLTSLTGAPFSYVGNNPLNDTDPLGLMCLSPKCLVNDVKNVAGAIQVVADVTAVAALPIPVVGEVVAGGALAVSSGAGFVAGGASCLQWFMGDSSVKGCVTDAVLIAGTFGIGRLLAPGTVRYGTRTLTAAEKGIQAGVNLFGDLIDWAIGYPSNNNVRNIAGPCDMTPRFERVR